MTTYLWFINLVFLVLVFITNNKQLILVFLGVFLSFLIISRWKLVSSLYLVFLLSLPYERGLRGWFISVVSQGPESWKPGYEFYFGLSIKIIIFITIVLLLFFSKKELRMSFVSWNITTITITLFFYLSAINCFQSDDFVVSIFGFIKLSLCIGTYIVGSYFFQKKFYRDYFLVFLVSLLFWFGLIGSWQYFLGHPIGLFLEETTLTKTNGFYTSDGDLLYRVSGLTGHPTFFGSLLSLLIPIGLGALFDMVKNTTKTSITKKMVYFLYIFIAICFGTIALIATFSRSAWFCLIFSFLLFFIKFRHKFISLVSYKSLAIVSVVVLISAFTFGNRIFSRIDSVSSILTIGNARGRINLVRQSLLIIKDSPLRGSGLNLFTRQMLQHSLNIEERTFFTPVHNTFLLFISELGIPTGLLFIFFSVICLYKSFKSLYRSGWVAWGVWVGAFTFIINAQFHTLFNLDPSLNIFMAMMAFLSTYKSS